MSSVNSDLRSFAVFVNSKAALIPSTDKSDVIIPFTGNLAYHDPLKVIKFSIVDVLFSNVFYNIRPNYQTIKILDVFAAGRGYSKPQYVTRTIVIPEGFYNYDTLTEYLIDSCGETITYTKAGGGTIDILFGFGSDVNILVDATFANLTTGKVHFNTPALGDLYQTISTTVITGIHPVSGIYAGKYLLEDTETVGLLKQLGFYSTSNPGAPIPDTPYRGIGIPIYSKVVASTTEYSFNHVVYGTSNLNEVHATLTPDNISDLTGLDDVYVHCSQLRTQYMAGAKNNPLAPGDVIAVIPVNVPFGDKMSFVPNFQLSSYLINTNITQLNFRMTNSNGEPLDFKNINWAMTLFVEEEDDTSRIQAENGPVTNQATPYQIGGDLNAGAYMQSRLGSAKRRK